MTFSIIIILVLISIFITILDFILDIVQWLKEFEDNITLGDYITNREAILISFILPLVNILALIIIIFTFLETSSFNLRKLFHYE